MSIALEGLQRRPAGGRRASWSPCIALFVGSVLAASACAPLGTTTECEMPEPRCSTIAREAAAWAAGSHPDLPVRRIRVLANGGYEIHYADGSVEAVVP